jgi:hypothetical protein
MWLQDSLAPDLQTPALGTLNSGVPRILTYGYDTHIEKSQSFQSISDLASQLRMSLRAIRKVSFSCERGMLKVKHTLIFQREMQVCDPLFSSAIAWVGL